MSLESIKINNQENIKGENTQEQFVSALNKLQGEISDLKTKIFDGEALGKNMEAERKVLIVMRKEQDDLLNKARNTAEQPSDQRKDIVKQEIPGVIANDQLGTYYGFGDAEKRGASGTQ